MSKDAEFDINSLMSSLTAFRDDVGFQLMEVVPLPETISNPLWEALKIVNKTIDQINIDYEYTESNVSIFKSPE